MKKLIVMIAIFFSGTLMFGQGEVIVYQANTGIGGTIIAGIAAMVILHFYFKNKEKKKEEK